MKKKFFVSASIIIFAALLLSICCFPSEQKSYRDVVKNISNIVDLSYTAKQKRDQLNKEIWFNKGKNRLQAYITGKTSEIIYKQSKDGKEILEHLVNVECYIQEKQYFSKPDNAPWQEVRFIVADNATFSYSSNTLIANKVKVKLYSQPGHKLDKSLDDTNLLMQADFDTLEVKL